MQKDAPQPNGGLWTAALIYIGYTPSLRCVTYLYYDPNCDCCYEKMQVDNNRLRARSISKTYQPAFFHLGECATYQPAIDQSDRPIQTVIVQKDFKCGRTKETALLKVMLAVVDH